MNQLVATASNQVMVDNSRLDTDSKAHTISSNLHMANSKEHPDNRLVMVSSSLAMDNRKHMVNNKPGLLDAQSPRRTQAAIMAMSRATMHTVSNVSRLDNVLLI